MRPARLALLLIGMTGCTGSDGVPIPQPDLALAEDAVRGAVEAARRQVRAAPRSALAWGNLGERLRVEGWTLEAVECYRQAERLDPSDFLWPYRLGKSLRWVDPGEAAQALARAIALDDGYAPAHLHYALTLVALGRFAEAGRHFERARGLDPGSAAALLGLGQLALSEGRIDEARGLLSSSLQLDPSDGRTHLALAQVERAREQFDAAERHALLARRLLQNIAPSDPRDRTRVESVSVGELSKTGRKLLAQGRAEEALRYLGEAVRLDPESEMPRLTLGLALVMLDRADEAEPQLRQAVSLEPRRAASRAALGKFLLYTRNRADEAEVELREALRLDPDDVDSRLHLGLLLARTARLAAAETSFREALRREPGFTPARYRLALLLAGRGGAEEAERELRETIRLGEATLAEPLGIAANRLEQVRALLADSHSALGYLLLEERRVSEALEQFRLATERRPGHALAQLGLGQALARRGEPEAAAAAFRRALQLRPDWPEALRELAALSDGG